MVTLPKCYWLASYPKSGNTWVRMFLEAYGSGQLDINRMQPTDSDINEFAWQSISPLPISQIGQDVQLLMRNAVLVYLIAGARRRPVIIKTHNINTQVNHIDPIPESLTAGGVYLVRDPRDVAISFAKHLGVDIDEAIRRMVNRDYILQKDGCAFQLLGTWSHNVKSWKDFCVVRYEDLLEDPHRWFTEILKGFRLKVNKKRLGKAIRLCEFERVKKQESKRAFTETSPHTDSFFHHGTSGHWKDILSPDQARRIENDHREVMEQYGYLKSNISELNNVA